MTEAASEVTTGFDFSVPLVCDGWGTDEAGDKWECDNPAEFRVTSFCCRIKTTLNCVECLVDLRVNGYSCIHCGEWSDDLEWSRL